ncbi:PI-type proteinase [Rhodococcus erythropolis]|uniref:PI-type proteinase n=1 Tax=Rhodococcus erythropolis TaxID=1833 RepID=UPI00294A61C9|nr:PI-type proteinase [Rhodococcus erythropolis]MDV6277668.1 PI-type proteinase [Rhodococcus erythropolis]
MSEQNPTDHTDQTDEPQTTGTGPDTARKDVQTDPSGERTWADEGGATSTGPAGATTTDPATDTD